MTQRTRNVVAVVAVAVLSAVACAGCHREPTRTPRPPAVATAPVVAATQIAEGTILPSRAVVLPGGPGLVRMDFIAYDQAVREIWIPAGNTGRVDLLDVATGAIRGLEGFPSAEIDSPHGRRVVGPSSIAVGEGVVYIGNRADSQICAVDERSHVRGACATVSSMPDAIALVPSAHEVWATTPREHTLSVLHVEGTTEVRVVATIPLDGSPECAAVDRARGVFYTNLEDKDRTLAIDVASRHVLSSWSPGCGDEGPRGLVLDPQRRLLFVACTDHVVTLDLAHEGSILGSVRTGGGVDDLSYSAARSMLYVASGETAKLRFVRVDARGGLSVVGSAPTSTGARNAVPDEQGRAYVTDPVGGRIFIVDPPS